MASHQILKHNILYSCTYQKGQSAEQFLPEHSLGIVLSGEAEYYTNEGTFVIKEGTIGLMHRNQLLKKYKKPSPNGAPFKLIGVFFLTRKLSGNMQGKMTSHFRTHTGGLILLILQGTQ